jgi:hypothetical protein
VGGRLTGGVRGRGKLCTTISYRMTTISFTGYYNERICRCPCLPPDMQSACLPHTNTDYEFYGWQVVDPCAAKVLPTIMNNKEVQLALGAIQQGEEARHWASCEKNLNYSVKDLTTSMVPVYKELVSRGEAALDRIAVLHCSTQCCNTVTPLHDQSKALHAVYFVDSGAYLPARSMTIRANMHQLLKYQLHDVFFLSPGGTDFHRLTTHSATRRTQCEFFPAVCCCLYPATFSLVWLMHCRSASAFYQWRDRLIRAFGGQPCLDRVTQPPSAGPCGSHQAMERHTHPADRRQCGRVQGPYTRVRALCGTLPKRLAAIRQPPDHFNFCGGQQAAKICSWQRLSTHAYVRHHASGLSQK